MQLGPYAVERKSFGLERTGFAREEVRAYLHELAISLARAEDSAMSAELEVGRLQRQVRDLSARSIGGFRESAARMVAAANALPGAAIDTPAQPQSESTAARVRAKAERMVEDALSTTEQIEANQARLLDAAQANREVLLREARDEADRIVAEARTAAETTRRDAQRFAEELRELTAEETIELVSYAKAMAASILEAAGGAEITTSGEVTIDLRKLAEDAPGAAAVGSDRPGGEDVPGDR